MKNRSLYAVLTRFGIVAAVLTALLVIAPAAAQEAAQEADTGPCKMNAGVLECDYDENGTDSDGGTYSRRPTPRVEGIDWDVEGPDACRLRPSKGGVYCLSSEVSELRVSVRQGSRGRRW